jgi:outer membrane protein
MMKHHKLLWLVAGLAFSVPALAEVKIGFVDVRAAVTESKTGKQFRAEMDTYIKNKQASLKKEEDKLTNLKQTLEKEGLTLSDAQKQQKQKDFQEKVQGLQKMAGDADRELRQKEADFNKQTMDKVRVIANDLAKSEKLSLILIVGREGVLYSEEGMDLTAKVVEKLDSGAGKSGKK